MSELKIHSQKIPMRLIGLTVALSTCLAVAAAFLKKDDIELNLMHEARKALSVADLPLVGIAFREREATLTGTVESQNLAEEIGAAIGGLFGVRAVFNQLTVSKAGNSKTVVFDPVAPEFEDGLYIPSRFHPLEKYNMSAVQFVYARLSLTEGSFPILDRLAMLLKQNNQIHVELSVHSDNQGTTLGQISSTQLRADILRQYLMSQGVDAEQLISTGYGATRPIARNDTEEGQQKNRRVELMVLKDG